MDVWGPAILYRVAVERGGELFRSEICKAPGEQVRWWGSRGARSPVPSNLAFSRAIVLYICSLAATPLLLPEEGDLACGTVPQPLFMKANFLRHGEFEKG